MIMNNIRTKYGSCKHHEKLYLKQMRGVKIMAIQSIQLTNRNKLAAHYVANKLNMFFPYTPFSDYEERLQHLQNRSFPREQLTNLLLTMNKKWGAPAATIEQIKKLHDKESVVIIGGQQAGLLTGPLYTINKIISILTYAKEQEEKLNIPVIPVFWIAGEDHDFAEINHIFLSQNNVINKQTTEQYEPLKKSVSHIDLDREKTNKWIKQVFSNLLETEYTKELLEMVTTTLEESKTYVDFFARLIFQLFPEEGLVLIDSAANELRQLESERFLQLIHKQAEITNAVYNTAQQIQQTGYSVQAEVQLDDANLFYHHNDERVLLKRRGKDWIGKNEEVLFSTEELKTIAKETPEKLSNNVITRPLMQESLFPTLGFIAGDGEISYWALLKDAFSIFDEKMDMPPVIPRLSITYINERVDKLLMNRNLDASYIINNGCQRLGMNWLVNQQHPPVDQLFAEAEESIKATHKPLQQLAESISPTLRDEAKRNMNNIVKELTYLKNSTMRQLQDRYNLQMAQFKEIEQTLRPQAGLQERTFNIVSLVNECGFQFIKKLLHAQLSFERDHYIVYVNKL